MPASVSLCFIPDSMAEQSLKDKTAKGLLWGGISNGVQQLLNLAFGIFLARILTPADYGMVGMLAIFTAIAGTLQDSGFTSALANKKEVTHRDYNAVFWFSFLTGITLYIILFFSAPLIAAYYRQPDLIPLARFTFLGFVISSSATAHSAYLFRNLMVKQKAIAQIPALVISGTVGILMAYNGMSYWGIATQSLVYIAIINLYFWYFSPWRPTFHLDFRPLKEMFGFSSKVLLTNIFIQTNNNIFSAIIGRLFLPKDVGFYTQANKWNTMGASLISGTINSVAQPVLAQITDNSNRQQAVFRKMLRFTSYLAFPAMFGLALIAPEFIHLAIKDKWMPCVPILQTLCIWGAFLPITTLCSNLVISQGKSNIYMWNTIAIGVLQVLAVLLIHRSGIYYMILMYTCINIGWLFIWYYFVHREIGLRFLDAIKDIAPFAGTSLIAMGVSFMVTRYITSEWLLMIGKILIAASVYLAILWVSRSRIQQEMLQYLFKKK